MSFRRYRQYKQGEFYIVAADTAWGGPDKCAAQFLCKEQIDVPVVYHSPVLATEMTPLLHLELIRIRKETGVKPVIAYETNNGGTAELERLAKLNRNDDYTIYTQKTGAGTHGMEEESHRYGWTTNPATRPVMMQMLKEAIDNKLICIYPLIGRLLDYPFAVFDFSRLHLFLLY